MFSITVLVSKIDSIRDRAGSGLDPNRNLTRGSRVSRNPNRTGSFFGDPEVNRDDNFMNRATRGNIFIDPTNPSRGGGPGGAGPP